MKCPQCGHQNAKHYKFCLECGAEIPSSSSDSSAPSPVKSKRVGIADAFDSEPLKKPSPETLIRQVEDLSSDIGLNTPLSTPITTPPMSNLKAGLQNPLLAKKSEQKLVLSSALAKNHKADQTGVGKNNLHENDPINFHTSLSSGRDSLASFEGEFFGELEAARSMSQAEGLAEESDPPPVPSPEDSLSSPAIAVVKVAEPVPDAPSVSNFINCHSCGAEIPKDFLFCGRCGAKVEQAAATSPDDAKDLSALDKLEPVIEETPVVGIASIPPKLQPPSVEAAAAAVDALGVATGGIPKEVVNEDDISPTVDSLVELVHIHLDGSEGESIQITDSEYTIGKSHDWSVFNTDDYLSDQHALLKYTEKGQVILKDLGGVNGIFLRLTRPTPLEHGDYFRAGQQLFAFESLESESSSDTEGTKRLGSPHYDAWGRLVHVIGQGEVGRGWLLHNNEVLLGRVKGEIIFDQDRFMSGQHCTLSCENDQVWLIDKGSTNGSFIRIREQVTLENEDLILLGQKIFRIRFK